MGRESKYKEIEIEEILGIDNEESDVAHDIGRIKEVFKDKVLYEGGSIKKIIDEIIGDLK